MGVILNSLNPLKQQVNLQIIIRTFLTLIFLALLSACGDSNLTENALGGTDLGSTGTVTKPLVVCNKVSSPSMSYQTKAQTLSAGGFDPNYLNMFMLNLPAGFEAGTTGIRFWKGKAVSDTTIGYDGAPLTFGIFDRQQNVYLAGTYSELNWNVLKNLIPGISAAAFFARVSMLLILQDPMGQYQVVSAANFNFSDGANVSTLDSLMPTFHANPSDYAIKSNGAARESILKFMHPFNNVPGNFQTLANNLCQ